MGPHSNQRGQLILPMGLALVVFTCAALGVMGLLLSWQKKVALQMKLDRCVGDAAIALRDLNNSIEKTNKEMDLLRIAIEAATGVSVVPVVGVFAQTSLPALRALLQTANLLQTKNKILWTVRAGSWPTPLACLSTDSETPWSKLWNMIDIPNLYPTHRWISQPPDFIGPRPLLWPPGANREFRLTRRNGGRVSSALIRGSEAGQWNANWTSAD